MIRFTLSDGSRITVAPEANPSSRSAVDTQVTHAGISFGNHSRWFDEDGNYVGRDDPEVQAYIWSLVPWYRRLWHRLRGVAS